MIDLRKSLNLFITKIFEHLNVLSYNFNDKNRFSFDFALVSVKKTYFLTNIWIYKILFAQKTYCGLNQIA